MFVTSHENVKVANQDAWRGKYIFPSKGVLDPAKNDRVLFKHKGIYVDITLSYNDNLDPQVRQKCETDYQDFLSAIELY